ncbi:hypothetical protein FHS90_001394 [Rufibacter quisquiliarum]|uniref:Uncharacterized protein n=1 Tax=Rufibacter quisquiliarum TaxID=1549639 RepID=A0A839GQI9_9BACT|nr:hypothetical protein [Rufibacter quisquiliarum]
MIEYILLKKILHCGEIYFLTIFIFLLVYFFKYQLITLSFVIPYIKDVNSSSYE